MLDFSKKRVRADSAPPLHPQEDTRIPSDTLCDAKQQEDHRYDCEVQNRKTCQARDVVAMAGICSLWRQILCGGGGRESTDSELDDAVWRSLFLYFFPGTDYRSIRATYRTRKNRCFSLFMLMVKVSAIQNCEPCSRAMLQNLIHRNGVNVFKRAFFVAQFLHAGEEIKSHYTSIGTLDDDCIVRFHQPCFVTLCEKEKSNWLRKSKNARPTANIYIALPSQNGEALTSFESFTVFKFYQGQPDWDNLRSFADQDDIDIEYGPNLHEEGIIGSLNGFSHLYLEGNNVTFAYWEPKGHYTKQQEEERNYVEADELQLRLNDLKRFLLIDKKKNQRRGSRYQRYFKS